MPKLVRIAATKLAGYEEIVWDAIQPRENLLVGRNGAGKSTLLEARRAIVARRQPTEPPDADPHVRWCGRGIAGDPRYPLSRFLKRTSSGRDGEDPVGPGTAGRALRRPDPEGPGLERSATAWLTRPSRDGWPVSCSLLCSYPGISALGPSTPVRYRGKCY